MRNPWRRRRRGRRGRSVFLVSASLRLRTIGVHHSTLTSTLAAHTESVLRSLRRFEQWGTAISTWLVCASPSVNGHYGQSRTRASLATRLTTPHLSRSHRRVSSLRQASYTAKGPCYSTMQLIHFGPRQSARASVVETEAHPFRPGRDHLHSPRLTTSPTRSPVVESPAKANHCRLSFGSLRRRA
jgi:hypothetical protein